MSGRFLNVIRTAALAAILGGLAVPSLAQTATPGEQMDDSPFVLQPVVPMDDTWRRPQPTEGNVNSVSQTRSGTQLGLHLQMASPHMNAGAHVVYAELSNGLAFIYSARGASLPEWNLAPGEVAIIRTSDRVRVGTGTGTVLGSQIDINADTSLLNGATVDYVSSNAIDENTFYSDGAAALNRTPGSYLWLTPSAPLAWAAFPIVMSADQTYGPQDPGHWRVPTPPGTPKPGDVNGDGRPDWDTGRDTKLPGTDIIYDGWVEDRGPVGADGGDDLVTTIGHDTNGNGKLEAGEVTAIIGRCVYVPGKNDVYWTIENGHQVVHHVNWHDTNGNDKIDPGEAERHYVYDTHTGVLKVFDENGAIVWQGQPPMPVGV